MPRPHNNPVKQRVFEFILTFKEYHDGNSPANREIMAACGIRSTSVVSYYLGLLVKDGLIEYCGERGSSRMISVVGGIWNPPSSFVEMTAPTFSGEEIKRFESHLDNLLSKNSKRTVSTLKEGAS